MPPKPTPSETNLRLDLFKADMGSNKKLLAAFAKVFTDKKGDWQAIEATLKKKPDFKKGDLLEKLSFTNDLAEWSGDNKKLIETFQKDDTTNSLFDIARTKSKNQLGIGLTKSSLPDGKSKDEYVDELHNSLYKAEPTGVAINLIRDPKVPLWNDSAGIKIATVLENKKGFNIHKDSVMEIISDDRNFKGIENRDEVIDRLKTLQCITNVCPADAIAHFINKGFKSSAQINALPFPQLKKMFEDTGLPEDMILDIQYSARDFYLQLDHFSMALRESGRTTNVKLIDDGMGAPAANAPSSGNTGIVPAAQAILAKHGLSWDDLFGDANFCECGECTSVYSPASYFVELLQYLRNNNLDESSKRIKSKANDIIDTPLAKLFNRRPDLGDLKLTCENTNIVLPYVDLVNEVMENYVVSKSPVFNVEGETSGELLSAPQHTEYEAYKILAGANYPFTLPYHQPIDGIRIYLDHLGTSRHELLDTFRRNTSVSPAPVVVDRAIAAEILGMLEREYFILTGEIFTGTAPVSMSVEVHEYYGYPDSSEMYDSSAKEVGLTFVKKQFLPRTGIQYTDLIELLKTNYINASALDGANKRFLDSLKTSYSTFESYFRNKAYIKTLNTNPLLKTFIDEVNAPQLLKNFYQKTKKILVLESAMETCNIDDVRLKRINGGDIVDTDNDYDKIHRFIRLWRMLGWTMAQTDQAIMALGGGDITANLIAELAAVKKLQAKIGIEITSLLCLWSNIPYPGENSLYKKLFLTHNLQAVDKVFAPDENGNCLTGNEEVKDHFPAIMAALNLTSDEIEAVLDLNNTPNKKLTIDIVSVLYRYRLMSKALGLKVLEFQKVVTSTLFGSIFGSAKDTLAFLEKWARMEEAGFEFAQLKYAINGGPLYPSKEDILLFTKEVYDGLNAIEENHSDVKAGDPSLTTDFVRSKAALLYDSNTLNAIMGILEGTTVYSITAPKNLKDLSRPIPIPPTAAPGTAPDHEFLSFDHYPQFRNKINYDYRIGALQVKGILTDGSAPFSENDIAQASRLIAKLTSTPANNAAQFLWNAFLPSAGIQLQDPKVSMEEKKIVLAKALNQVIDGPSIYSPTRFPGQAAPSFSSTPPTNEELIQYNRSLLESAFSELKNQKSAFLSLNVSGFPSGVNLNNLLLKIELLQKKNIESNLSGVFGQKFLPRFIRPDVNETISDTALDFNTAPSKRFQFLSAFLPHLREELAKELVTNLVVSHFGFELKIAKLLLFDLLTYSGASIYHAIKEFKYGQTSTSPLSSWPGFLIPASSGMYNFGCDQSFASATISLNGQNIAFLPSAPAAVGSEKWTSAINLEAGKVYEFLSQGLSVKSLVWKTSTSPSSPIPKSQLIPSFAKTCFAVMGKLKRCSLIVNRLVLSFDELKYMHTPSFGGVNIDSPDITQFFKLEAYTRFRKNLKDPSGILVFWAWVNSATASASDLSSKIASLTGSKEGNIKKLISASHFGLTSLTDFTNELNLLKLQQAVSTADKIGIDIDKLFEWSVPSSDFDSTKKIADSIQKAIRAKYKQTDWELVAKPLHDQLRNNQKEALIAYLLQQPAIQKWGVTDANGLFEFFLIDVQMDACMETSRIKQAISSVQLFIQRCLLGLEEKAEPDSKNKLIRGVTSNILDQDRWKWMQRYRLWEANRKVFLYPENWIESNLRDDKSPFFKELESELLQKDINKENVIDALKTYLYKVDEVANMEVVGVWVDDERKKYVRIQASKKKGSKPSFKVKYSYKGIYVFTRTRNAPYSFYHRYFDASEGNWYPWKKIQVDIPCYDDQDTEGRLMGNGCYLIPIVWDNRLLIFFPQFVRKTLPNDQAKGIVKDLASKNQESLRPIEYWEVKMAWSELRNEKWTQKQLSDTCVLIYGSQKEVNVPNLESLNQAFESAKKSAVEARNRHENVALLRDIAEGSYMNFRIDDFPTYVVRILKDLLQATDAKEIVRLTAISAGLLVPILREKIYGDYVKLAEQKKESLRLDFEREKAAYNASSLNLRSANNEELRTRNDLNDAISKAYNQNTITPISRIQFVPALSNNVPQQSLVGIVVYNGSMRCGAFEFNGSQLRNETENHSTVNNFPNSIFHHEEDMKRELFFPSRSYQHVFKDKGNTTYHRRNQSIDFYHPSSNKLLGKLNSLDPSELFTFYNGNISKEIKASTYGAFDIDNDPSTPEIYHELKRPYSLYNWELFFHTPTLLADALSKANRFEEAMKWFHFVFDPFADGTDDKRFWKFAPFKEIESKNILDKIFAGLKPNKEDSTVNEWRNKPFMPHVVARNRPVAYMKWVVMKYIDNLLAWGDHLFRQDTIESINQATQLYVLALHILGDRPMMIPKRTKDKPETYNSLLDKWDAFGNAMRQLEVLFPNSNQAGNTKGSATTKSVDTTGAFGTASSLYFCIPNNPKLLGYWDTLADRLFKIRHCQNIEGVFRKLPLFEPPIDPALLVNAAAQGLSLSSVLNDLQTSVPNYRFYYLLQKAIELCGELKSLGGAMLSAIEKKDNEMISLIRAKHESGMHNLVMEIKKLQLSEAQQSLDGLRQNRKGPEHRMKYYLSLIGQEESLVPKEDSDFSEMANSIAKPIEESGLLLNQFEKEDFDKADESQRIQEETAQIEILANLLFQIPMGEVDTKPMGIGAGIGFGGLNLGNAMQAYSSWRKMEAGSLAFKSSKAGKKSQHLRAMQDRIMQANAAGYEIKQIDKQILSQQIRIDITNREIVNQQKQIENANEVEEFIKNKYSNEELYTWMRDSLKTLYHQVYTLAFDLAKKAEKTYCFERGFSNSNFIKAGYFDAGREGLLAGEQLYVGLKQLEAAYQEKRGHDYEITKHVSLRQLDPLAILLLRNNNSCEFEIPEVLFDLDYPGHYMRRIKSVSISIPCVTGPYAGVNSTLRLLQNKFRNKAIATNAGDYLERTDETDERFSTYNIPITSIATASGQNDSGMFELNFKDERYLPFEGAGAASRWRLELPSVKQFDYNTISDVILHIKYTSKEGGETLKAAARSSAATVLNTIQQNLSETGLHIMLSMKHDMPNEWNLLKTNYSCPIKVDYSYLPYLVKAKTGTIAEVSLWSTKAINSLSATGTGLSHSKVHSYNKALIQSKDFTLSCPPANPNQVDDLDDLIVVVKYSF
jgi:hypothetical protein